MYNHNNNFYNDNVLRGDYDFNSEPFGYMGKWGEADIVYFQRYYYALSKDGVLACLERYDGESNPFEKSK